MDERTVPRPCAVRLDGLGLSSTDAFVLSQIDGTLTLEEVSEVTGISIAAVLEIARRLAGLGAIAAPGRVTRPEGRYSGHEQSEPKTSVSPKKSVPASRRAGPMPDRAALARIPRRTSRELRSLALETGDAFLLSLVDGAFSIADLAEILGDDAGKVAARVLSLVDAGALELHDKPRGRVSKRPSPPPAVSIRPVLDDARVTVSEKPEPPPPPPPPVDDTCELDAATCAKIDEALSAPDGRTHYAVLGVVKKASGKEIQRAYFALAATLHPDRHFGKKLGPYKQKLDRVFRRATEAYDALRIASKRAEYDAYLQLTHRSTQMERVLASVVPEPPKRRSSRRVPAARKVDSPPPVRVEPPPVSKPVRIEPPPVSKPVESKPVETPRRAPVKSKSASILEAAQQALVSGDAVAAANHYRLALQYAEDPGARRYAESGLEEARRLLVDTQLKKARYEEKEARWTDAVASYTKALDGRPDDPAICERLANALRQEGSDLQRAARLAELAVQRAPRRAAYRSTLGFIYAEAGSREKAIEQFERAVEIDPEDELSRRALETLKKRRR
ncbi:MAG: DnaJ domain-containing protein [Polyangiales bacterium]